MPHAAPPSGEDPGVAAGRVFARRSGEVDVLLCNWEMPNAGQITPAVRCVAWRLRHDRINARVPDLWTRQGPFLCMLSQATGVLCQRSDGCSNFVLHTKNRDSGTEGLRGVPGSVGPGGNEVPALSPRPRV
jgi:hypothetical protein